MKKLQLVKVTEQQQQNPPAPLSAVNDVIKRIVKKEEIFQQYNRDVDNAIAEHQKRGLGRMTSPVNRVAFQNAFKTCGVQL
jgi:hypothetical protein